MEFRTNDFKPSWITDQLDGVAIDYAQRFGEHLCDLQNGRLGRMALTTSQNPKLLRRDQTHPGKRIRQRALVFSVDPTQTGLCRSPGVAKIRQITHHRFPTNHGTRSCCRATTNSFSELCGLFGAYVGISQVLWRTGLKAPLPYFSDCCKALIQSTFIQTIHHYGNS